MSVLYCNPDNLITKEQLEKFSYLVFGNDEFLEYFRDNERRKNMFNLLMESKSDQLIFGEYNGYHEEEIVGDYKIKHVKYTPYNFNNLGRIIDKIKHPILKNTKNPYIEKGKGYTDINFTEYAHKIFKNAPGFKLLQSIINIDSIKPRIDDFVVLINDYSEHYEYMVSLALETDGFKTSYVSISDIDKTVKFNKSEFTKKHELDKRKENNHTNLTIVTGYLKLPIKRPPKRHTQKYDYLEKANGTLSINQNMIIFLSEEIIPMVVKKRTELGLMEKTHIVKIDINDLYMIDKLDIITKNTEKNKAPYNIPQYIMAVNSRYGYMERAIKLNQFKTDYFMWVDFSAGHIVEIPRTLKFKIANSKKIRIAWIARFKKGKFFYNHEALGGGVFGGHKDVMKIYCHIHDIEFKKLVEKGYNINDDKLCFFIFEKYPYLFDIYFSGYSHLARKF